ncbi:uncharacterized protein [Manis javanica]|uniref:uncharacterized protein n=1 Tax=Manis javanica TaxID=9974 RepID=UPI003C6CE337
MLTCRRPSSSARVWASARETRASLPGWFLAAPRLAAPWRVSSISWPGGPGQPLLPGQEAQPLLGLGPLRGVETPWRPEPELRLPGAGAACARAALAAAPTQGARARRARLGSPVRPWPSGGSQTALPERSPIPAVLVARAQGTCQGWEKPRPEAARALRRHPPASCSLHGLRRGPGRRISLLRGSGGSAGSQTRWLLQTRAGCIPGAAPRLR